MSGCTTLQSATNKQVKTNTNARHAEVKKTVLPSRWAKQLKTTQAQSVSSLVQLIQLPHLRTLVNSVINQNPGLQRTLLASKSAELTLRRNKANFLPIVSADFGGSRAKQKTGNTASSYNSGLNVSWELDLWKKLADKEQGFAYDKVASDHDYQAARASLAANVMKSYLNLIASQQELSIEQRRSRLLKNNQEVITERYRSGLGSLNDLETARSSSAKAMASLVQLKTTFEQDKRSLAVLVGQNTRLDVLLSKRFPAVIAPLATTPVQTIAKRPDIKAALLRIEAEDSRTRASYKELLPSFSLSGGLSSSGSSLISLLFKDPLWSLLRSLTVPIFNGGKIKTDAKLQELSAEKAYLSYREALLVAIQEVENALENEISLQRQQSHQLKVVKTAIASETHSRTRYQQGLASFLDLLNVQQSRFDAELSLIRVKVNHLTNRITLGLALGIGA